MTLLAITLTIAITAYTANLLISEGRKALQEEEATPTLNPRTGQSWEDVIGLAAFHRKECRKWKALLRCARKREELGLPRFGQPAIELQNILRHEKSCINHLLGAHSLSLQDVRGMSLIIYGEDVV